MTDKLTEPMPPTDLDPRPLGKLSGDWNDDDAGVYEDDFTQADHRPETKVLGVPHPVAELKPTTRILGNTALVGNINGAQTDPIMLFPADPNRVKCIIQVMATNGTEFTLSDSKTGCYNGLNFYSSTAGGIIDISGHTGAVWAHSISTGNSVKVSVIVVTV
jgi:hypothetical protein